MKTKNLHKITLLAVLCLMTTIGFAQLGNIHGMVSYHNNGISAIAGVTVSLKDANGNQVASTISNENGLYALANIPYGAYTLTGSKNNTAGGVTMADVLLINQYTLGQAQFNPIQLLAADVDLDGSVTQQDYLMVMASHLTQGNAFPVIWVFEEVVVELTGGESNTERGLGGSSSGDVNGTFYPVNKTNIINFFATNLLFQAIGGEEIELPVTLNEPAALSAMHLVLEYPSNLVDIKGITSRFGFFDYSIIPGRIIISAADLHANGIALNKGEVVATIKVRVNQNFNRRDQVVFNLNPESHFVNQMAEHTTLKVSAPVISFKNQNPELYPNYPNPFSSQTLISYKLNQADHVNLSVYDMQGKLVAALADQYQNEGIHQLEFRPGQLARGTYICRLSTFGNQPTTLTRVIIITSD